MDNYNPLFMTCTARGGSYVTAQLLSANDSINIASEPYLELFRALRNKILIQAQDEKLLFENMDELPFLDYYYSEKSIKVMEHIQNSNVDIPLSKNEWDRLIPLLDKRAKLQCNELRPYLHELFADNYLECIKNAINIIPKARKLKDKKWIGIKDAWIVELFLPLARSFPNAKFIIIIRDPRASIASNLNIKNKSMVAHVASFARNWRKLVAFATYYNVHDEFKDRLFILTHAQLLENPDKKAREICKFLDVEFQDKMLDTSNYIDFSTGKVWKGNSSFEENTQGLKKHRINRWKHKLSEEVIKAVEFICMPDMKLIGCQEEYKMYNPTDYAKAIEFLLDDSQQNRCWRTDTGFYEMDYGPEYLRKTLLNIPRESLQLNLIKRCFLFEHVFKRLQSHNVLEIV